MNTNGKRKKIQECYRASDDIGIMAVAEEALDVIDAQAKEIERAFVALRDIAGQQLIDEMEPEDRDGDYEFAYEQFIKIARKALAKQEPS
jgi:hypothetical protein